MIVRTRAAEAGPSIELTPIIDIVFLLLIFFLVATTYRQEEREMRIALPEAESGAPIVAALRELVVNVDRDGGIVVGGRPLDIDAFRSLVLEATRANPRQKVTVRGDRDASYGAVARVLDACKGAGVQEPFLDTVPAR